MKALVCEMCNSNDIVKQDDYFVCQNCGTKYVVEEVRKIKTEVPVVIDETAEVDNYYKLAESAIEAGENWEAEYNCDEILDIDINHWKAWLLKGKAVARQLIPNNLRVEETFSCFTKALDNAPEECIDDLRVDIANEVVKFTIAVMDFDFDRFSDYPSNYNSALLTTIKEKIDTVIPCSVDFLLLKCGVQADGYKKTIADKINASVEIAWNGSISKVNKYKLHPDFLDYHQFVRCASSCIDITQALIDLCDKNDEANIQKYKNMIEYTQAIIDARAWDCDSGGGYHLDTMNMLTKEAITLYIDNIMEYHYKIKEIDPNYVVPKRPKPSGCYIATCVYGSYDCPQVWTLRRFRDFTLAKTWYGRAFIKIYYTVSPTLVKLFGNTKWFKKLWKSNLDRLIKFLKEKGFEDTAYYDR